MESVYKILLSLQNLDIIYSRPVLFGKISEFGKVYMILTWINGENVEIMMPKLSKMQQYECGFKAGQILHKIHSISGKGFAKEWKNKQLSKLKERLRFYKNDKSYIIKHLDNMLNFIYNNMDLLNNRPMTLIHGDYQGRNIIVDNKCNIGIIDFERILYGDPYEEFNRMMIYTRRWSIEFCKGQINGYFSEKEIPENFWKITALHCAISLITTITYGHYTNQKYIYEENEISNEIIYNDYKSYTSFVPEWFTNR